MSRNTIANAAIRVRQVPDRTRESYWFTTHDAARALHLTPAGVRYLENDQQISCQRTPSRRRLFLKQQILDLVAKRAAARLVLVPAGLPQALNAASPPRQLALFHVRLALVQAKDRLSEGEAKVGRVPGNLFGVR